MRNPPWVSRFLGVLHKERCSPTGLLELELELDQIGNGVGFRLYEGLVVSTIVVGLRAADSVIESGRTPGRDSWRIKETAKRKIAAARLLARATAGCTFGCGKRARCPSLGTRPALSRSATRYASAPAACATNISRPNMARRPVLPRRRRKLLLLRLLLRKLLPPDSDCRSSA